MRIFSCSCNQATLFFESVQCTACGRLTGFCSDLMAVTGFDVTDVAGEWSHPQTKAVYRQCANYSDHQVCNWMIPANDPDLFCRACRLNEVIPDLSLPQNQEYWRRLEIAKRHALYTILELQLPLASKLEDPELGLTFRFMADSMPDSEFAAPCDAIGPIFTGHNDGTITINLAEADDIARTRTRIKLGESYRTLLGHVRHEIGHYYWYRLLEHDNGALQKFRKVFGDETVDYTAALQHHYDVGPPPNWSLQFISAYASMHPWEDWAECWAHYMHMLDTLETAQALRLGLNGKSIPSLELLQKAGKRSQKNNISVWLDEWMQLSIGLNALNRSMGMPDAYPFVVNESCKEKLQFIHQVIQKK